MEVITLRMETDRLIIRDQVEADLYDMHRLWSDKKTMYYLDDIMSNSIEDTAKSLKIGIANADGQYFCICEKTTGNYMGNTGCTITDTTPFGKIVHLGYMLLPEYHGKGYMTEAVKKIIEFVFTKYDCIRITTGCHKENDASRRVIEKVGFRLEAEKIKAVYHDGVMKDRLEYAINKDDYIKNAL
jgi:ribosomal-protein-alanine N-acetyltransferase